jgi:D-alanyl-D-alanine carboxypeptidase/D-alanyl-D-alanine-endopeptidase (penicillin-binding protein 4)
MWATTRPISALNLNFNRVFFEWERTGEDYTVRMDARSDNHSPMVTVSRMTIEPRDYPVYTFDRTEARDEWTVAQRAGQRGRALAAGAPPARLSGRGVPDARACPGSTLSAPVVSESAPPGARSGGV